jgi:hypothetical protein
MRAFTLSRVFFALVLIGWGIIGLFKGDFAAGWLPVPESLPAREALAYLTAIVCIDAASACCLGTRPALAAARACLSGFCFGCCC